MSRAAFRAARVAPALLCLVCLALSAGCAPPPKPAREPSELLKQPESFVARVARLRQLSERKPTPVLFDDEPVEGVIVKD